MFNLLDTYMITSSHTASHTVLQQRFRAALMAMAFAAIGLTILFPLLAPLLPHIPTSGHSHVHAHGHAFIDARSFFGIPNCLDVLSNLPFLICGVWGLIALQSAKSMATPLQAAARVFFIGLIFTCFGSSYYHYAPSDFGLMIDRLGMAVAFAGVISLAAGSRLGAATSERATPVLLILAPLAAIAAYTLHNVVPWAIVQFGGMALIVWLACLPRSKAQPSIHLGALIALYALAKLLEVQDAQVFELTQGIISGHSLKHIAASLAAVPVIAALRKS
jgi:MFS family permease